MVILALVQILAGRLSAFLCWVFYWLWVCHNVFYYVKICSLYAHFGKSFFFFLIMNGCWTLSNAFSAFIEMIVWFWLFFCWCGAWPFLYVVGCGWLKFCWEFLHQDDLKTTCQTRSQRSIQTNIQDQVQRTSDLTWRGSNWWKIGLFEHQQI